MANDWFRFKQFRIQQDRCAMKVSTDACIQGALAADYCAGKGLSRALDIGAGTGLLSLMLLQQNPGLQVDAIELDLAAFDQATDNCGATPWQDRIRLWHTALQDFHPPVADYDFIVCNPPFFHNQLQAGQQQRNQARHSVTLTKASLAAAIGRLLQTGGSSCIMYPASEWAAWHQAALQQGLHLQQLHRILPTTGKACNRIIGWYGPEPAASVREEELTIYTAPQQYTEAFCALLQPFYLHL